MSSFKSAEPKDPASSQEIQLSDRLSPFSPQIPSTYGRTGRKERRNPSITPRKFRKFFTPRSLESTPPSSARQALNDITAPSNNRNGIRSSPILFRGIPGQENSPALFPRDLKRRKLLSTPESSPEHAYIEMKETGGLKALQDRDRTGNGNDHRDEDEDCVVDDDDEDDLQNIQSSPCERAVHMERIVEAFPQPLKRIVPIHERGLSGKILQSITGASTRSRRQHLEYPVNGNVFPFF